MFLCLFVSLFVFVCFLAFSRVLGMALFFGGGGKKYSKQCWQRQAKDVDSSCLVLFFEVKIVHIKDPVGWLVVLGPCDNLKGPF